ncbi:hypothetical protein [Nitratidesulfovibrio termitidis]|uniref:hypothetical protein n=1 Tax=Nitratidesulfovibrio termitidis TaxID=42252 RepID=UPI0012EB2782|nr:hypothetical protein [Nitratidesulfovibrio termitidis]
MQQEDDAEQAGEGMGHGVPLRWLRHRAEGEPVSARRALFCVRLFLFLTFAGDFVKQHGFDMTA